MDDIDIAGDMVAEVAAGFNLKDLSTTAHFPVLMDSLQSLLAKVTVLCVRAGVWCKAGINVALLNLKA